MKKVQSSIVLAAIVLGGIALTFAATGKPAAGVTADDLSRDLSMAAQAAGGTEVPRWLMTTDLGKSANAPLTEAGAVAILQKAGMAVTTSSPDRLLTRDRADALVRLFTLLIVTGPHRSVSTIGNSGQPDTGVDTCFDEKNHGQCVKCCKALGGGASFCANACMVINKPSPSEPIP